MSPRLRLLLLKEMVQERVLRRRTQPPWEDYILKSILYSDLI
jgi:hypothetical protein